MPHPDDQSQPATAIQTHESGAVRLAGTSLGRRAHICGFFSSPEEERRILLPFVQEGLGLGEKAVHTIDPRRREEHLQWLSSAGLDVKALEASGQFDLRDWKDSHLRQQHFDGPATVALFDEVAKLGKQRGFPLTRFVTQMEWVLEAKLNARELLEYEASANYIWIGQTGPINPVICTYDLTRFTGDVVINVMRTHPLVIIGGILQENPFFVPPEEFLFQLRRKNEGQADAHYDLLVRDALEPDAIGK